MSLLNQQWEEDDDPHIEETWRVIKGGIWMDRKKDIMKILNHMSGRYSAYEVFSDWICCSALAVSNACQLLHDRIWRIREQEYMNIIKKYEPEGQVRFSEMFFMLVETLEHETEDVLGCIYMESEMGNKTTGQFFTPWSVSVMCAEMSEKEPDPDGYYKIYEPSCGAGGMIIALACALRRKGINYQKYMKVVAQDLDWKSVYMCYLQLSLLGIRAVVVQGDTLTEPYIRGYPRQRVLYTPGERGMPTWKTDGRS